MELRGKITVHPKKTRSIERFHPWVFSGAIRTIEGRPQSGDMIEVSIPDGKVLGYGFYTPDASIAVRMTHFGSEPPTPHWITERLEKAYSLRNALGLINDPHTNAYRLVHGEGDQLPGLIIDYYNGVLVMQCHTAGMWLLKDAIAEALRGIYGQACKAIYNKSEDTLPEASAFGIENHYAYGETSTDDVALENDIKLLIDWEGGQKTGFFIDQRENRALLGEMSKGKKVLNTFSYTGGFSLYALRAGASLVHSLDSSRRALDIGEANVELNGFDKSKHASIQADAVQYLKNLEEDYDIMVLDPPAFAKHQRARHKAVQAYKRINAQAIRQIRSGGLIFTFSCSQAIDKQLFTNTVIAAAIEAKREVRILHQLHQPADHPVNAFHPEGEYLKGLVLWVG